MLHTCITIQTSAGCDGHVPYYTYGVVFFPEFGLACHLGVLSRLPCIGVAKNLLQVQGVEMNEEHQSQVRALPLTFHTGRDQNDEQINTFLQRGRIALNQRTSFH